jgi:tetratricopeptide (TPR) repeat protein
MSHGNRGRFHCFAVASLALLTLPLFVYTVHLRAPWFGTLSEDPWGHQWLTAGTVKFSRNWYREGIFHLRFTMLENPASIEFPTFQSRHAYASYPPVFALPVYALALLIGQEPSPGLAMGYNLANHCLVAWLLGVTAYVVLLRAGIPPLNGLLFAAACPCLDLLCPAPLYFHQNVYAMDAAVILPFVVCLLLESLRPAVSQPSLSRLLAAVQWGVFFVGYLTDWLFVFVGLVIYVKRLLLGEIGFRRDGVPGTGSFFGPLRAPPDSRPKAEKCACPPATGSLKSLLRGSVWYWSPAVAAGSLFVIQLTYLGWWQTLYEHVRHRIGATPEEGRWSYGEFLVEYFRQYLPLGYGVPGSWLMGGSLLLLLALMAYAAVRRVRRQSVPPPLPVLAGLMAMAILPCCLHLLVLWEHSGHTFSLVKFSVPLALIPFALAPAVGVALVSMRPANNESRKPSANSAPPRRLHHKTPLCSPAMAGLNLSVLLLAGLYLYWIHPGWLSRFPKPTRYYDELATALARAGIGYRDIVVSPDFEVPENPPQRLACTMKRVYLCSDEGDLARVLTDAEPPFRIMGLWVRGDTFKMRAWEIAAAGEITATLRDAARYLDGRDSVQSEIAGFAGYEVHLDESQFDMNAIVNELFARRQYREVIHVLSLGKSPQPDSADRCCYLGVALAQLGRCEEAIAQFEAALRINPNLAAVHFRLGDLLAVSRPQLAMERYLAGLRLDPDNVNALNGLAIIFMRNRRFAEAVPLLRRALQVDPNNPALRANLEAAMRGPAATPARPSGN